MKTKLSKTVAEVAEPRSSRYNLWDSEISGFGLRVTPAGMKSWVVKYRTGEGGRSAVARWYTIGGFPEISASDARKAAEIALARVRLGEDPGGERITKRAEMTLAQAIDFYEQEGCFVQRGIRQGEPMKPMTKDYTLARLRHHVVRLLGKRRVTEIDEGDITTFVRDVSAGKTARDEWIVDPETGKRRRVIVRGGEGAARKVVRDLSAVYSFLKTHKRKTRVTHNPVEDASVRKTDNKRTRFLSIDEVKRLGAALDTVEAAGANAKAVNIARLWALSGCRRNEIAGLKWSEVDLERGLLIFDDSKTGRSVRPLGAAATALLEALKPDEAEGYVFPAERGDGFYQGTKTVWQAAIKKADLPGVTPHVLRHTLGSTAASAGEALLMVGSLLGHANARSTAIYAHISHDPARMAADRVTAPIAEALGRPSPAPKREQNVKQPADA
ncbi:MAG TPA: tyrosine-type recombinase/integrase [Sphingopyxis sp.]|uniref:tyrosine-type recombinase/integrase n=1 Tax=Sphingopyxis sp. TaxID=1908224 RepID=UPI002C57CE83|nr:tyrosine-type recombinase/integrase [Sphingopyxis sp.]HWW59344.1 tyrosine-type recombinase/integrase [Sphingopyxis sp.]